MTEVETNAASTDESPLEALEFLEHFKAVHGARTISLETLLSISAGFANTAARLAATQLYMTKRQKARFASSVTREIRSNLREGLGLKKTEDQPCLKSSD